MVADKEKYTHAPRNDMLSLDIPEGFALQAVAMCAHVSSMCIEVELSKFCFYGRLWKVNIENSLWCIQFDLTESCPVLWKEHAGSSCGALKDLSCILNAAVGKITIAGQQSSVFNLNVGTENGVKDCILSHMDVLNFSLSLSNRASLDSLILFGRLCSRNQKILLISKTVYHWSCGRI